MSAKPTLLILAAGMGSRYGGIKQIDPFGPNGETIIDYSLYDAIRAGYGKVVFIIRKEIETEFREIFTKKLEGKIEIDIVCQEKELFIPKGMDISGRVKPWGTGHAVLCAKDAIKEPFAVINADDFYGYHAFKAMADFLAADQDAKLHSLVGYKIENTLSENGSVSRGVCTADANDFLTSINERTNIDRKDGKIIYTEGDKDVELPEGTLVSMNFFGFQEEIFNQIEPLFLQFLSAKGNEPKAEFFIPLFANQLLASGEAKFKVLNSSDVWFGVTYKEDKPTVQSAISQLIAKGAYPEKLWV